MIFKIICDDRSFYCLLMTTDCTLYLSEFIFVRCHIFLIFAWISTFFFIKAITVHFSFIFSSECISWLYFEHVFMLLSVELIWRMPFDILVRILLLSLQFSLNRKKNMSPYRKPATIGKPTDKLYHCRICI